MCEELFSNSIIDRYYYATTHGLEINDVISVKYTGKKLIGYTLEDLFKEKLFSGESLINNAGEEFISLAHSHLNIEEKRFFFYFLRVYQEIMGELPKKSELKGFTNTTDKITMTNSFEDFYQKEEENLLQDIERTRDQNKKIDEYYDKVKKYGKMKSEIRFGEINVKKTTKSYKIYTNNQSLTGKNSLDLFNDANLNELIPFMSFTTIGENSPRTYFKVYQNPEKYQSLDKIIPKKKEKYDKFDHILFTIWLGGLTKSKSTTIKSYETILINFEDNEVRLEIPRQYSEKDIIAALENILPNYKLIENRVVDIKADFTLSGFNFREDSFLHLILNDTFLNKYLYMDERNESYPYKTRFDLHFQDLFNDLIIKEKSFEMARGEKKYLVNYNTVSFILHSDSIIIKKCPSQEILDKFYCLLRVLFIYFNNIKEPYDEYYSKMLNSISGEFFESEGKKTKKKAPLKEKSNLAQLQDKAPNLFAKNYYATVASGDYQPSLATEEEYNEAISSDEPRSVLRYPYPDFYKSKTYIYLKSNKLPYMTVVVNNRPDDEYRSKFPYLPKALNTDPINDINYKNFLKRIPPQEESLKISKILVKDSEGKLPIEINNILPKIDGEYSVLGINRSNSSFIHCVLRAIENEDYLESKNREEFVEEFRRDLFETQNMEGDSIFSTVLKQEMYNFDDEEIVNQITNPDVFFDSLLFYRIIEELFDINIYVFFNNEIEIPHFNKFYSKPYSNRPTVLLLRVEVRGLTPQYQLIQNDGNDIKGVFTERDFNSTLYSIFKNSLKSYLIMGEKLKQIDNFGFSVNYNRIFKTIGYPRNQIIDSNGKSQLFTIKIKPRTPKKNEKFSLVTLYCPPYQPFNCPLNGNNDIHRVSRNEALDLISRISGKNISISINEESKVDGIWFQYSSLDFYIPVFPDSGKELDDIIGPISPIKSLIKIESTDRIYSLRKQLNFINQIIRWLYQQTEDTPEDFFTNYVVTNDSNVDSLKFYSFKKEKIPRFFPEFNSINEALKYVAKYYSLVQKINGEYKIVTYNDRFYHKLFFMINEWISWGGNKTPITEILNYYLDKDDFTDYKHNKLFLNKENFDKWIEKNKNETRFVNLITSVDEELLKKPDPIIYGENDEPMFIIQNVISGTKDEALFIILGWNENTINYGYNSGRIYPTNNESSFNLYKIGKNNKLELQESETELSNNDLLLHNDKYYALLRLKR